MISFVHVSIFIIAKQMAFKHILNQAYFICLKKGGLKAFIKLVTQKEIVRLLEKELYGMRYIRRYMFDTA